MDGDGDLDLIAGNIDGKNRLYLGDGSGGFSSRSNITTDVHQTYSLSVVDVDGDNDLDVVAGNRSNLSTLFGRWFGWVFIWVGYNVRCAPQVD